MSQLKTIPAPYGKDVVDDDGNKMSHVIGADVDQGAAPLRSETLGENLKAIVEKHPSRECIVDVYADVSFTYERFYNRVLRLATSFVRAGYRKGDRIGIWSTNRWEWTVVQYACHHLGLILVNINPAYRQHELNYVLEKAGVRCVFAARRYKDSDYRTMLIEASKQRGVKLDKVIYFGSADWYERMHGDIDDLSEYTADLHPDDPINIQFTSGTTGFPKGATLTHRNLLNNGYFIGELLGYTEKDRVCLPVPFFHTFGMVIGTFATFSHGGAIIIPAPSFKARETLKAVHSAKATSLYGVPTMFITELEEAHDHEEYGSPYDLSTLRTGVMAGTSCPSKTMRDVMDKLNMSEIAICYGMTETSPVSFQTRKDSPLDKRVNTVGQIMPHLEARVIDEDTGETLPRGEQGEVVVRGYSVMKEYWHHPEKTAEAIDEDGWMHTGDLGVLDDEGYLSITGRIKDMLIRGGENIYPREIEEFLFTHPDIVDAQVIGVPDDKYGEEIMAWVILHDENADLTADQIAEFAQGKLSRHKIPRYVHVTDSFPMTASGKVRKVEMREMAPKLLGWV
ncbi:MULTISPECIES: AMP-binding protein [Corynebacterium]|uniref:Fatty-acyl-CoA synthase n=1 Tax=Corynebacterium freneyi TaxID=134034 RepID=A0ABS4UA43_9CORY|nr:MULTISPECIES: AMP-binding protein [Corynebacterium]MBP2333416.1 fatty-acyl-CoA synthase [Corynebacterium freneyi]OFU58216.1 AMP-binding protein [Corynebacterium sp. HMSC11E11]QXA52540.1 AMP-binding protein [Corynebacterium freneyi]WJZ04480.1 Long-chain-fatty-acid--CoA ligase [Corynebacterium freneyi]